MGVVHYSKNLHAGVDLTVKKLLVTVHMLDSVIAEWAEQLNRAQPLLSGRVVIRFSPVLRVSIGNDRLSDYAPKVGKMIKLKNDSVWKFKWIEDTDVHDKLSDLRVGRSMPSDRVVVRLLDGLEAMMIKRERLIEKLIELRASSPSLINSAETDIINRADELEKLKSRIKLDWHNDAAGAFEVIRKRDRIKNQSKTMKYQI